MLKVSNNVRQLCPIKSHVNFIKKLYLNVNLGVQQLTACSQVIVKRYASMFRNHNNRILTNKKLINNLTSL